MISLLSQHRYCLDRLLTPLHFDTVPEDNIKKVATTALTFMSYDMSSVQTVTVPFDTDETIDAVITKTLRQ